MFLALSAIFIKLIKFVKVMAQIGISIGVAALLGLYSYQSKLIYPAAMNDGHGHCSTPDEYDMPYELVNLHTRDGVILQCFLLKQDPECVNYSGKTILILSPNAGNIGRSLPIVSIFYKQFGYNVFIYSYRGYGKSTGSPSEDGLKIDADRVVQYLTVEDEQYASSSLVLYGRSLGGAVAIYIAATMSEHVDGLILENTFLSIRKTVPHIFPLLKYVTKFVHQIWDLELLVPKIPANIPALLISARKDEIVPPAHMDKINSLLRSTNKTYELYETSAHNDTIVQPHYWDKVHTFIERAVSSK